MQNQTSICCLGPEGPSQKIEFVISCQSRNISKWASGACAPSPSRLTARPGRLRAEETLLYFPAAALRGDAVFVFYYQKVFLAAVHGHQVGHELPCHSQRGPIGISLLLLSGHRSCASAGLFRGASFAASIRMRLQMLVALLGERRALHDVRRTLLGATQPAIADGLLDRGKALSHRLLPAPRSVP